MSAIILKPPPWLVSETGQYQGPTCFDLKDGSRIFPDASGVITIPSSTNRPHDNLTPMLAQGWTLSP